MAEYEQELFGPTWKRFAICPSASIKFVLTSNWISVWSAHCSNLREMSKNLCISSLNASNLPLIRFWTMSAFFIAFTMMSYIIGPKSFLNPKIPVSSTDRSSFTSLPIKYVLRNQFNVVRNVHNLQALFPAYISVLKNRKTFPFLIA